MSWDDRDRFMFPMDPIVNPPPAWWVAVNNFFWWGILWRIAFGRPRLVWLEQFVYRYQCPHPIIKDRSARACYFAGHCGCDNAARFSPPE